MPRSHLHPHSPDPALSSRTFPTVTLILVILALLALVAGAVGYALPLLNIFFQPRIRTRTRTFLCPIVATDHRVASVARGAHRAH